MIEKSWVNFCSESFYDSHQFPDAPGATSTPEITDRKPGEVTLSWSPPESDGGAEITGYVVEKKDKFGTWWSRVTPSPITGTTFTVTGMPEGQDCEFRIVAENKAGLGSPSQSVTYAVKPPDAPSTPEVSDIQESSVVLSWSPPKDDGGGKVTGYIIEKKEPGKDTWVRATRIPVKETKYKVTDLVPKHEYEFRVTAENKAGIGAPSEATHPVLVKLPYGKILAQKNALVEENYDLLCMNT